MCLSGNHGRNSVFIATFFRNYFAIDADGQDYIPGHENYSNIYMHDHKLTEVRVSLFTEMLYTLFFKDRVISLLYVCVFSNLELEEGRNGEFSISCSISCPVLSCP